ncbi:Mu-type opioid receptor [Trichinella pseudospiralis]
MVAPVRLLCRPWASDTHCSQPVQWNLLSKKLQILFSPKRTVIMIFSGWLFGFAISAPFLSSMCHYHFLTNMFVWGFLLQYPSSVWFIGVDVFIHLLALITLCILYTFMLQKLKLSSRRFLNRSKELSKRRLVIQAQLTLEAVAMNLSLLVVWIAFYTLPLITLNKWCLLINSCLAILNSSIFALLNLLFKRTLHRQQSKSAHHCWYALFRIIDAIDALLSIVQRFQLCLSRCRFSLRR